MSTVEATWLPWMGQRIMSGDKMDFGFWISNFGFLKFQISNLKSQISNRGFTLVGLAVIIAITGIVLATVARVHSTILKRDLAEELLFRGDEIKDAIDAYFKTGNTYPRNFEELLKDPRGVNPKRHLRKVYKDPVTNGEWELIKDKAERIIGEKSKSEKEPLKKDNFPEEYKAFTGKTKYSEWEFISKPVTSPVPQKQKTK